MTPKQAENVARFYPRSRGWRLHLAEFFPSVRDLIFRVRSVI